MVLKVNNSGGEKLLHSCYAQIPHIFGKAGEEFLAFFKHIIFLPGQCKFKQDESQSKFIILLPTMTCHCGADDTMMVKH